MPGIRLDAEQKALIAKSVNDGLKAEDVARQHGVSVYTVYRIARGGRPVARKSAPTTTAAGGFVGKAQGGLGSRARAMQTLKSELSMCEHEAASIKKALIALGA